MTILSTSASSLVTSQTVNVYTTGRPIFYLKNANLNAKVYYQVMCAYAGVADTALFFAHVCDNYENLHTPKFSVLMPAGGFFSNKCVLFTDLRGCKTSKPCFKKLMLYKRYRLICKHLI